MLMAHGDVTDLGDDQVGSTSWAMLMAMPPSAPECRTSTS
jgi:hypothetical protein